MKYTDVLLVMNKEDYDFAKKHFKNTTIKFVNGVGFNKERIEHQTDEKELKATYKKSKGIRRIILKAKKQETAT